MTARDDNEAIDQSNIIGERTRGAAKSGGYREPGDEEGLPGRLFLSRLNYILIPLQSPNKHCQARKMGQALSGEAQTSGHIMSTQAIVASLE